MDTPSLSGSIKHPSEFEGKEILARKSCDPQRRWTVVSYNPKTKRVNLRDDEGEIHNELDTDWRVIAEL